MSDGGAAGVPDFTDVYKVEAWLRTQPRDVRRMIAARAALRVLPLAFPADGSTRPGSRALALAVLRATVAASLAVGRRTEAESVERALHYALRAVRNARDVLDAPDAADPGALEAARAATLAAALAVTHHADHDAAGSASSNAARAATLAAGVAAGLAAGTAATHDAASVMEGSSAVSVRGLPLWSAVPAQDWAAEAWSRLRAALDRAEGWQVWIDWYEARLRGDPYDEALEECYVLIPEEVWEQGPAVANAEIARRIAELKRERHAEMLQRIAALETRLGAQNEAGPFGMGHNHPPEPLEEIQPALQVLKSQAVDAPDLVASRGAVTRLRSALSTATGYAGAKLNLFIDEAAKSSGKASGLAVVAIAGAHYAGWVAELSAVIEAAARWLATFPP